MSAAAFFDAARALKRDLTGKPAIGLTDDEVEALNVVVLTWERQAPPSVSTWSPQTPLTSRIALEIIGHEAIVREAYKDSKGIWTWSVGITNASGHNVDRYKDNPQTIARCLEIFFWVLRERYIPPVAAAFKGFALTEAQFAAALSFHYNTGAIGKALWVTHWKAGDIAQAHERFMDWKNPPEIIPRREKERDLFFDGKWSNDGRATVFPVRKPSYQPDFAHAERVDIGQILSGLLA